MLGKQGWKLLADPNALVSRIYKAKYYPKGDFLSAIEGENSSYIWKSIWAAQKVIKAGYRWRLGSGKRAKVWGETWLREEAGLRVLPAREDELRDMVVSDLLIPELPEWDAELIEDLMGPQEADCVLGMKPPCSSDDDERIWHFSQNGLYTVRSAYRLITEAGADHLQMRVGGNWRSLWQVEVPPKIKHHVWRLARRVLPTRMAIRRRGMDVESSWGCCGSEEEDLEHLFFGCVVAERCWTEAGVGHLLDTVQQADGDSTAWLFRLIDTARKEHLQRVFVVLWAIWKERNDRVWNRQSRPPEVVVRLGWEQMEEWRIAQARQPVTNTRPMDCRRWHKPEDGRVKVNVDAALCRDQRKVGIGIVARDSEGRLLGLTHRLLSGVLSPKEAEAQGLVEAIRWAITMQLGPMTFETDCQVVYHAATHDLQDNTEFGGILRECRRLLHTQPLWLVSYVRRECNRVADALAKRAIYLPDSSLELASPDWLVTLLEDVCPVLNH
ncbi:Putative ribonuclease H protein At1g65750 [Linum perenne]